VNLESAPAASGSSCPSRLFLFLWLFLSVHGCTLKQRPGGRTCRSRAPRRSGCCRSARSRRCPRGSGPWGSRRPSCCGRQTAAPAGPPASVRPEACDKRAWRQQDPSQCCEPPRAHSKRDGAQPWWCAGRLRTGARPQRGARSEQAGGLPARARTSWKPSRHWQVKLPGSLMQIWSHDAVPSAHSSTSWQSTPSPRQPAARARALAAGRGGGMRRATAACSWACVKGRLCVQTRRCHGQLIHGAWREGQGRAWSHPCPGWHGARLKALRDGAGTGRPTHAPGPV